MLPARRRRKKEVEDPEDPWNAQLARALLSSHDLVEAERLIDCGADINAHLLFPDLYPYATLPLFIALLLHGDVSAPGLQAMQFLVDRGCTARRRIRLPSGDRGTVLHALVELNDVARLQTVATLTGIVDSDAPRRREEKMSIRVANTRAEQRQRSRQNERDVEAKGDDPAEDVRPAATPEGEEEEEAAAAAAAVVVDETTSQNYSKASRRREAGQKRSQGGNKSRKGRGAGEGRHRSVGGEDGESLDEDEDDDEDPDSNNLEGGDGSEETHKEGVTIVAVNTANGEVHTSVLESYTLLTQPMDGAAGGSTTTASAGAPAGTDAHPSSSSSAAAADAGGKGKHAGKGAAASAGVASAAASPLPAAATDAESAQKDSKPSPASNNSAAAAGETPQPQRLRVGALHLQSPPSRVATAPTHESDHVSSKPGELAEEFRSSKKELVVLSLVNYDAKTRNGRLTAVELALATHRPTLVGPLLANGATHDFTKLVNGRHTLLARACIHGDAAMVRTLLAAGDDPRQLASDGGWYSLVHYAVAQPHVLNVLKNEFHIPLDSPNVFGDTALISLIKYGAGRNLGKYVREAPSSKDAAELPGMQVSVVNNYILVTGSALPSVSALPTSGASQPRPSQYQHQQQQQQQDASPSVASPSAAGSPQRPSNGEASGSQQADAMNTHAKDTTAKKSINSPSAATHAGISAAPGLPSDLCSQLSPAMAASLRYVASITSSSSDAGSGVGLLTTPDPASVLVGDGTTLDRDVVGPWVSSSAPFHFLHGSAEPNFWYFSHMSTWEMIRTLVDCGVDVNSPGNRHAHNNAHAAASSAVLVDLTAMKWLSSTATAVSTSNSARAASLSVAANRVSSRSSALLPSKFFHGMSPLMHAIHAYQPQLIRKLILDFGADVNRRDAFGATAVHYAATCSNVTALQFLLAVHAYKLLNPAPPAAASAAGAGAGSGAGAAGGNAGGGTSSQPGAASPSGGGGTSSSQSAAAAAAAAAAGAAPAPNALDRVVPFDINAQDDRGMTPLHCAVAKGNVGTVCLLLLAPGILPGLLNAQKQTPLHLAVLANELEIVELLSRRCAGEADFLAWMQTVAAAVEKVNAPDPTAAAAAATNPAGSGGADVSNEELRKSSSSTSWTLDGSPFAVLLRRATRTASTPLGAAGTTTTSSGSGFITPSAILAAAKSKLDLIAKENASNNNSGRGKQNSSTGATMRESMGNRNNSSSNNNASGRWHNLGTSSPNSPQRSAGSMRGGRRNSTGSGDDDAAANNVLISSSERMDGGRLDVDDVDASGRTALEMAVCSTQSMRVVEVLVNIAGAIVNIPFSGYEVGGGGGGGGSIEKSGSQKASGADGSGRGQTGKTVASGFTLLHKVVLDGNVAMVEFLLRSGADVSERDALDRTPLMVAFELQHSKIAELCLAYGSAINDQSGTTLETCAHIACRHGNASLLQLLLHPPAVRSDALTEYGKKNRSQAIYVPRKKKRGSGNGMQYRGFELGSYGAVNDGDVDEDDDDSDGEVSSDSDAYNNMYGGGNDYDDEDDEWDERSSRGSNATPSNGRNSRSGSTSYGNEYEDGADERIGSQRTSESDDDAEWNERGRSPGNYRRRTKVSEAHRSSATNQNGGTNHQRARDSNPTYPWASDTFTANGVRSVLSSYRRSALFSVTDRNHRTPVHLLCAHSDAAVQRTVMELLREMIWLESKRAATSSSSNSSGQSGGPSIVSIRDRCGRTALHESCLAGFTQATKLLLSALLPERLFHALHDPSSSSEKKTPSTAAAAAAAAQSIPLVAEADIQVCEAQCVVPLTVLFARDSNGWTALHNAVAAGDTKAVDLLLATVANMLNTRAILTYGNGQRKDSEESTQQQQQRSPAGKEGVSRFLTRPTTTQTTTTRKLPDTITSDGVIEGRETFASAVHRVMPAFPLSGGGSGVGGIASAPSVSVLAEVMALLLQCDSLGRTPLLLAGELGKPTSAVSILSAIRAVRQCEAILSTRRTPNEYGETPKNSNGRAADTVAAAARS